ncbi:MAG: hypothetical protein ACHQVK_01380, partial [Candidatus Paceibacterales bacterium]
MSIKLEGLRDKLLAFTIDALLILMPGLIWFVFLGLVIGYRHVTDMDPARRLLSEVILGAAFIYPAFYLLFQIVLLLRRGQTIGLRYLKTFTEKIAFRSFLITFLLSTIVATYWYTNINNINQSFFNQSFWESYDFIFFPSVVLAIIACGGNNSMTHTTAIIFQVAQTYFM